MRALERGLWMAALGLLVFFGAWFQQGLQPDAALYAGLARKILVTRESWRLAGTSGFFPIFFDHPPYFMQWGARVLAVLGTSDGAARAIGGLPGILGFGLTCAWTARRLGPSPALWTAFALATFTHYTKFAATAMLEAPLSLGVMLAAVGTFESLWGLRAWGGLALALGLALASAAKGVAGLGALGGAGLVLAGAWLSGRARARKVVLLGLVATLAALAPLGFWIWKMTSLESLEWISGYFVDQVGRSAVSTRGDAAHAQGGSKFFYLRMILWNGWPWWWTVPTAWVALWRRAKLPAFESSAARRWAGVSAAFSLAFALPFSLVSFQLAHYIHPIYLPCAPLAGLCLAAFVRAPARWPMPAVRWGAWAAAAVTLAALARGESRTRNRGQDFARARAAVAALPADCPVIVRAVDMDAYRMEAYGLWYWQGHPWRRLQEGETVPATGADWNPARPEQLAAHGLCGRGAT